MRLAVDASRTSRKRKQEGGRCSKASRGRRPVRKRPSSLKYVPAGGNYAFNYLNEWPGIQRDFPLYLSLPSPLLFFSLAPRPIPPLVKLPSSFLVLPGTVSRSLDDIRGHLAILIQSSLLFSRSLLPFFCFSCLVTELPLGPFVAVCHSVSPFPSPFLFLFSKASSFNATPFQLDAYRFRLTSIFVATDGEKGEVGATLCHRPDPTRIPRDETVNWWLKGTQGSIVYSPIRFPFGDVCVSCSPFN